MSQIKENILGCIGSTPIIRLNRTAPDTRHQYFGKIEYFNPGGSVKDRIAVAIIEEAEKRGELKPGGTIVEATSGNTGSGLALVAAVKGYKTIFCMPEKISEEKRAILRAYGAQVVITPNGLEPDHPNSFYSVAKKLSEIIPGAFYTNQYHNPDNVNKHYTMTGPEIWEQMEGQIDVFVAGAGTGGTLSGVGRYLKEKNPNIKIVMADPVGSILYDLYYHKEVRDPVASYIVEGIGEDMLPENVHFNFMDAIVKVNDKQAFTLCRRLAREEGLLVGPSTGSNLSAAGIFGEKLEKPSRILVMMPDSGKSYLSKAFNESFLMEKELIDEPLNQLTVKAFIDKSSLPAVPALAVGDTVEKAIDWFARNSSDACAVKDGGYTAGFLLRDSLFNRLSLKTVESSTPVLRILDGAVPEMEQQTTIKQLAEHLAHLPFVQVKGGPLLSKSSLFEIYKGNHL